MEPLPHRTSTAPLPARSHSEAPSETFACERPESPDLRLVAADDCPGCRVWLAAIALEDPDRMIDESRSGGAWRRIRAIDALRSVLADDPMLVLVERELARRG